MAFGNSITEGKTAFSTAIAHPYPELLNLLLATRYIGQVVTVVNKGLGGERAVAGSDRLKVELDAVHPGVVLLEEGINDIADGNPANVGVMTDALRDMVRKAKARGVTVLLATLLPTRAGGTPPRGDGALPLIQTANGQIRLLAASEDVILVDLYAGFGGSPDPYIDVDGLHPTQDGYQKIADIFFQTIKARLELPANPASITLVKNMPTP
jgi:lysophospholipase L1-like esterase